MGAECEVVTITTQGDDSAAKGTAANLKGAFTKALEEALLEGRIDLAVHSLKDVPAQLEEQFELAMLSTRGEVADVLIAAEPIAELRHNAVIGTGSLRRRAQLQLLREDLTAAELRGNINTRLAKLKQYDGIVLAACGLARLGITVPHTVLDPQRLIPAPGQGIIAVEGLRDKNWRRQLAALDDKKSRTEATAERAFIAELGASCKTPVGAWANAAKVGDGAKSFGGGVELRVFVGDYLSRQRHFRTERGDDPKALGIKTAAALRDQASEEFWQRVLAE